MKTILIIIGVVLFIVVIGDLYLLYVQKHTNIQAVSQQTVQQNSTTTTKTTGINSTTTSAIPLVVSVPTKSNTSTTVGPTTLSVLTNYKGNPLRALITCKVNTTRPLSAITIMPGDGSIDFSNADNSNRKIYDQTYTTPGTYTVECSPSYVDGTNQTTSSDSPSTVKKIITIGGYTAPARKNINFTFLPVTGTLPIQVQTTCGINTTGNVTSLAVGVDSPSQIDFTGGETLADKFIIYTSNNQGIDHSATYRGLLPSSKYWKGVHNVYCSAIVNNQMPEIISKPIQVNFQ